MKAPLEGVRVIEMAGKGPAPFAAVMLAEAGASVLRIERPGEGPPAERRHFAVLQRSRPAVALDLKDPSDREALLGLLAEADVLIEGFRPGVMERLGLGPEDCAARNPRLVYGRVTGWGQTGPLAQAPGHDINFLALSGALAAIGQKGADPVPPMNLLADFAGGGFWLVIGILLALRSAQGTGRGQVVDAAMLDGVLATLLALSGIRARGDWKDARGSNFLDGGAPYYRCYRCADGRYVAVGAMEPAFWNLLLERLGLPAGQAPWRQGAQEDWEEAAAQLAARFATRPREDWVSLLGDACCVSPVLELAEVADHPHQRARGSFLDLAGVEQPRVLPRLSRSAERPPGPATAQAALEAALQQWREKAQG